MRKDGKLQGLAELNFSYICRGGRFSGAKPSEKQESVSVLRPQDVFAFITSDEAESRFATHVRGFIDDVFRENYDDNRVVKPGNLPGWGDNYVNNEFPMTKLFAYGFREWLWWFRYKILILTQKEAKLGAAWLGSLTSEERRLVESTSRAVHAAFAAPEAIL